MPDPKNASRSIRGATLRMDAVNRTEKRTKFGSIKQVYGITNGRNLRGVFEPEIAHALPPPGSSIAHEAIGTDTDYRTEPTVPENR